MSRPARPSDATPARQAPGWVFLVILVLGIGYSPLAHWANVSGRPPLAVLAAASLILMLLAEPLACRRLWAWLVTAALLAALGPLWDSPRALLLLAAPPVVFTGWVGWFFGRSLLAGRTPLITRIVQALYLRAGIAISAEQRRYTRRLTAAWAGLLGGLALLYLVLGLCAVPGGVLVQLGLPPPLAVPEATASLIANLLGYGVIGGFFIGEYLLRARWFPVRPYRSLPDFIRHLAALGPVFWRDLLR